MPTIITFLFVWNKVSLKLNSSSTMVVISFLVSLELKETPLLIFFLKGFCWVNNNSILFVWIEGGERSLNYLFLALDGATSFNVARDPLATLCVLNWLGRLPYEVCCDLVQDFSFEEDLGC